MGSILETFGGENASSLYPDVRFEVLWSQGPNASDGDWCDITRFVTSGSCSRGRRFELDAFESGSLSLTLEAMQSEGRLFDPEYTSGPFYRYLVPMRQIRVSAVWAGTYYPVWRGYVMSWGQTTYQDKKFVTTISARDGFARLAQIQLPSSAWALEVQKDDPSLWFRLGETDTARVTDSSDGGNYGLYDNVTQGAQGLVPNDSDGAISGVDTVDSRVTIQNPSLISGYPFSIGALFQVDGSDPGHQHTIFAGMHDPTDSDPSIQIRVNYSGDTYPSKIGAYVTSGGAFLGKISDAQVDDDLPHHILFVVSSSTTSALYVDGVDSFGSFSGPVTWPGDPATGYTIGNYTDVAWGDFNFLGTIDEVVVWDGVAITAARAADHSLAAKSGWDGDFTGERVARFLDAIDWPANLRNLDTGISVLGPASWSAGSSALSAMQSWADTEAGEFYMDGAGILVWRSRHARYLDTRSNTSQATFGDTHSGEALKVDALDLPRDENLIRNPVTASRSGGVSVTVKDQELIETKYGNRTWSSPTTEDQKDSAVRDRALFFLARYKEVATRLAEMRLSPWLDTDLWPQVLGRELGDRITIKRTPLGFGNEIEVDQWIERIEHAFTPKTWTTTVVGSPVDTTAGDYLILDDATYGELDAYATAY
jgi:hypothetical protein